MGAFIPRGYKAMADVRKELGHDELRQQLASGERAAFFWDQRDVEKPFKQIHKNQWLQANADEIIRRGKAIWRPYPLATLKRDLDILIDDVKPNVPPPRAVGKGGRPAAADWDVVALAIEQEIDKRGFPEHGLKGWETQADVERFVADFLQSRNTEVSDSTIRDRVREILNKLRPAKKGGN
jgi:hypothetical protein